MSVGDCLKWAEESYQECAEYRDDGHTACSQYRDDGYNSCAAWGAQCCDWWPCSWFCEVISWFCYAWYWVSNLVCVAWYWVANLVCIAWTTVVTTVCVIWEVTMIILAPLGMLVELILSIPVLGGILRQIIAVITEIIWRVVGILDGILDLLGICFLKKLRIYIVILKDEKGNPVSSEQILQPHIDAAKKIYKDEAKTSIIVKGIYTVDDPSPGYALDHACGVSAWGDDLWLAGSYFESRSIIKRSPGGLGKLIGYGTPITVFAVRSIAGNTAGCSLGPLTDYVTVEGSNPVCIAHELAHALGLWHVNDNNNLANPACGGEKVKTYQRIIMRNSKHVTYV